jgi:hypothetical protein
VSDDFPDVKLKAVLPTNALKLLVLTPGKTKLRALTLTPGPAGLFGAIRPSITVVAYKLKGLTSGIEMKLTALIPETDLPDSDVHIRALSPTVMRQ